MQDDVLDRSHELGQFDRFCQERPARLLKEFPCLGVVRETRHEQDALRRLGVVGEQVLVERLALEERQAEIADDGAKRRFLDRGEGGQPVVHFRDHVPGLLQDLGERPTHAGFVFDDQDVHDGK